MVAVPVATRLFEQVGIEQFVEVVAGHGDIATGHRRRRQKVEVGGGVRGEQAERSRGARGHVLVGHGERLGDAAFAVIQQPLAGALVGQALDDARQRPGRPARQPGGDEADRQRQVATGVDDRSRRAVREHR